MRVLICLLGLAIHSSAPLRAADNTEKKETVAFDGVHFLIEATHRSAGERVKEFLPTGQKLNSWTKYAAIREFPKLDDPKAAAIRKLEEVKKQNPGAAGALIQNPKTGEAIVDYITWPSDSSAVEFHILRYSKMEGGGLAAQEYALREFSNTTQFLKELKTMRPRLVDLMAKSGLQKVK